jgi:ATP-dependent RNA helicase DDX3X
MSVEVGINFDNYDDVEVEITGPNAPEGLETWQSCDFSPVIRFNLTKCKFKKPTPIQKWSVPCVRNFRNTMACAQTGSGKTAAFLVPTIDNLLRREDRRTQKIYREPFLPRCLVIAPTRELAQQIHEQARKFLYCTGMRACCAFGGQKAYIQLNNFKHGMDVLIGTPGRLNDMVGRRNISLAAVQFLILDEADRMLDMGFDPQIREICQEHDLPEKEDRTTLMFSATFPSQIQQLAADFMGKDYLFIAIGRIGAASEMVTQQLIEVSHGRNGKFNTLVDLLEEIEGKVLVFTATKRTADDLHYDLEDKGHKTEAIHGDKSQGERESALKAFKTGKVRIMVGTDVCARGLDIPNVEYVIQYDLSHNIDDHVHRIGRTGRCGNEGIAIAFVKGDENIVRNGDL